MRCIALVLLAFLAAGVPTAALAGSSSIGVTGKFEREPDDLGEPVSNKIELKSLHRFDEGVILGGSAEYSKSATSDSAHANLETTLGFSHRLADAFSLGGSAGIGEHVQLEGSGNDFPYYVFRVTVDIEIDQYWTWKALGYRYRSAFDTDNDFLTPQIYTGVGYNFSEDASLSGTVEYNWKDGVLDSIGFTVGFHHKF